MKSSKVENKNMKIQKAKLIVELISKIADGISALPFNSFCNEKDKMERNLIRIAQWKNQLVELFTQIKK